MTLAVAMGLSLCSCSTAGYYTGRTLEKTGHVIAHGGEAVENHTE